MNAHSPITAQATAEWFHCRSEYGSTGTRHVIVTMEPSAHDRRYLVANDRQFALLKAGMAVDDLELTEIDGDDDDA